MTATGPPRSNATQYDVRQPARIEMIVKEMAKFWNPPIALNSCCAYPSRWSSPLVVLIDAAIAAPAWRARHPASLRWVVTGAIYSRRCLNCQLDARLRADALTGRVVQRLGRDLACDPLAEDLDLDRLARLRRRLRARRRTRSSARPCSRSRRSSRGRRSRRRSGRAPSRARRHADPRGRGRRAGVPAPARRAAPRGR